MKKIAVIGLGIIGSSICRALRKAGCFVAGSDLDGMTLSYAKNQGYIQEEAENFTEYDAVFWPYRLARQSLCWNRRSSKKGHL